MNALWNKLFVPALVVAFGFSAVNVHADDHSNTSGSHGTSHPANHQASPANTTVGKPSSSSSSASSANPGMDSSNQQASKHDSSATGTGDHGTPVNRSKTSGLMHHDMISASTKKTTNTKKDPTGTAKGTKTGAGTKMDSTLTGSKSTSSNNKKESPWGGNQKTSDWGGYGGNGGTGTNTDSKNTPPSNNKKDSPWGDNGKVKGNKGSTNDSPWGDQAGKGGVSTKTSTSSYPAGSYKMDPCPKEMPKYKTGGCWTQEQCTPKWNSCATYNKWTSCPSEWHVKFHDSYCLPTNYCYWQKKYFNARCGGYTYYDSYSSGWYYYEPVVKCYIPVSYCEQYQVERTESLQETDVCEVEVSVCETVRNYTVLPVKPVCQPYNHGCR